MPRKRIAVERGKVEKEKTESTEKTEEDGLAGKEGLSPEIRAEVEAAVEEELRLKSKAQEILEAQAEAKRLEILNVLDKAVREWRESGSVSTDLEPRKSLKESLKDGLKSNVQAAGRLKDRIAGLIRRLAELKSKSETAEIRKEIERIERELKQDGLARSKQEPEEGVKPLSVEQEIEKFYKEIEDL